MSSSSPPAPAPVRLSAAAQPAAIQPSSPRFFFSSLAGTNPASPHRRIAIAVDLSDESAFAVKWSVQNYLRPGDAVVLLHVRPTSVLYGADWGSVPVSVSDEADGADGEDAAAEGASEEELRKKREEDYDAFTSTKAQDLAQPLVDAHIPFKIHVVKDHDMKERLCLEAERLGLSAMIMGSRGFGASRKGGKGRLGSVSDYCVHHCVCPVVVVRCPDDAAGAGGEAAGATDELHTVPEDEPVYHDAPEVHKEN
ncbi:universal stress protein PHOS34-like [Phragmites australis]|uniref:universal stress protein PHOS34-like n=1 Tax=Phragmites australis TaxID=29695 RepID=UPI002D764ABC|nr:universal stress protein PHOS34-like [Phragmites australis]